MHYIVEIIEPTNNPGNWTTKLIFDDQKKAEAFIEDYVKYAEYVEEVPATEWDEQGPNWKRLKTLAIYDEEPEVLVTLDEVDTGKALEIYS